MRGVCGGVDGSALALGADVVDGGDRLYHAECFKILQGVCMQTLALLVSLGLSNNRVHDKELRARGCTSVHNFLKNYSAAPLMHLHLPIWSSIFRDTHFARFHLSLHNAATPRLRRLVSMTRTVRTYCGKYRPLSCFPCYTFPTTTQPGPTNFFLQTPGL
jgi:hypothetical protein